MTHGYLEKMLDMLTNAYNRRDLVNVQKGRPLETNIGKLFSLFAFMPCRARAFCAIVYLFPSPVSRVDTVACFDIRNRPLSISNLIPFLRKK